MLRFFKKNIFVLIIIAAILSGFVLGIFFGQYNRPSVEKIQKLLRPEETKPAEVSFDLFWDVWRKVEEKYVNRGEIDAQKMVYGAINGMLKSLDDPYTIFLEPQESKQFMDDMKGSFEGVGMEIGMRKGQLMIIAPLEGTPAFKAGLLAGDKILSIDGESTAGMSLDEAVKVIRGPKDTEVVLTISRDSWEKAKEVKIIRGVIQIPILQVSDKEGYTYIKFYQFTENAAYEFRKVVNQILNFQTKGVIIDLRNNPGGYLEIAVDISSWFLPANKIVAIEDFGNNKQNKYYSRGYNRLSSLPLVILINQGSASASEILAGSLRDNLGIQLIGEKSFGKGSVQELDNLKGGSSLKITIAKWLTPSGKSIMDEGLEPDIVVEMTEEDIEASRDPQLDKALEVLQKL